MRRDDRELRGAEVERGLERDVESHPAIDVPVSVDLDRVKQGGDRSGREHVLRRHGHRLVIDRPRLATGRKLHAVTQICEHHGSVAIVCCHDRESVDHWLLAVNVGVQCLRVRVEQPTPGSLQRRGVQQAHDVRSPTPEHLADIARRRLQRHRHTRGAKTLCSLSERHASSTRFAPFSGSM